MRRSTLNQFVVLTLMGLILTLTLRGQTSSLRSQLMGTLKGTLMDVSGRRVAGATVLIEGGRTTYRVVTDKDGAYQIELQAGLYHLSVSGWKEFSPARRAAFYLPPSTVTAINFILIERKAVAIPYPGAKPGEFFDDGPSTDIKYEVLPFVHTPDIQREIGVQFGEKHEKGSVIEYKAELMYRGHALYGDPHPAVVVSYNLITIYANRVFFNRKSFKLKAEGNVIVEEGDKRVHAKSAVVDFTAVKPILKLKGSGSTTGEEDPQLESHKSEHSLGKSRSQSSPIRSIDFNNFS